MLITIFGKRGSGKTTMIRGNLDNFPGPIVVMDALGNFTPESTDNPHFQRLAENYRQTEDISEMIEMIEEYFEAKTPEELEEKKVIVVRYGNMNEILDYACAVLWHAKRGGTLVLDEIDMFSEAEAPCFAEVVRYGRNRDIHVITGCRRPAEISKNITAGADRVFVLKTTEPRDIEYYEKTLLHEDAVKLMNLPRYHGLYLDHFNEKKGLFRFDENGQIELLSEENLTD